MALYVSPAAWSSGTGRALWLRAKDIIVQEGYMTCSLWVFPQNSRAIKFYRAAGFALTASSLKQFELGQTKLEEVRYACIVDR
jgi:ribosomal protein S18 acetylase RimI-like enzyme